MVNMSVLFNRRKTKTTDIKKEIQHRAKLQEEYEKTQFEIELRKAERQARQEALIKAAQKEAARRVTRQQRSGLKGLLEGLGENARRGVEYAERETYNLDIPSFDAPPRRRRRK